MDEKITGRLRREGRYHEIGIRREPKEDEADQECMRKKERGRYAEEGEGKVCRKSINVCCR